MVCIGWCVQGGVYRMVCVGWFACSVMYVCTYVQGGGCMNCGTQVQVHLRVVCIGW